MRVRSLRVSFVSVWVLLSLFAYSIILMSIVSREIVPLLLGLLLLCLTAAGLFNELTYEQ